MRLSRYRGYELIYKEENPDYVAGFIDFYAVIRTILFNYNRMNGIIGLKFAILSMPCINYFSLSLGVLVIHWFDKAPMLVNILISWLHHIIDLPN